MKVLDRVFHFTETLPLSDRVLFKLFLCLTVATTLWALATWSTNATIVIPERGGVLTEGIIGTPRFVNPVLAVTSADRDLVAVTYAGLMKLGTDGTVIPNMAESITISDDGLTYNIILKENLTFHDGTPVTTHDVVYTIGEIQDPMIKSPLRGAWDGVTVEYINDRELNFVLTQPFAPFIENLTVGILPRHIWEATTAEEMPFSNYNSEPIGSGPYQVKKVMRDQSGIPVSYTLVPFRAFHHQAPHIEKLTFMFYPNESELRAALESGVIENATGLHAETLHSLYSTEEYAAAHMLYRTPLPKTFALFFNQNENPVFRDSAVRSALDASLDRERLVADILGDFGVPIDGPLPPSFGITQTLTVSTTTLSRADTAREILRQGGWKVNETTGLWEKMDGSDTRELKFSITTVNTPAFEETAENLRATWSELGIPVDIKKFEQSDLTQSVIRPREYEALLFGTNVGRELDLYSFWHSSQRNDPGLNVALYANIAADSELTDTRTKHDAGERISSYERLYTELRADLPALFLYVPEFTYSASSRIKNISLTRLAHPSERFANIEEWYTDTESVWPSFADTP